LLLTLLSHIFLVLHISRSQISSQGLLKIFPVCTRESNCFISLEYSLKSSINSKSLIFVLFVHSYPAFDFLSPSDKGIIEMTNKSHCGDSDSPSNFPLFVLTLPILFPLRLSFVFYSLVVGIWHFQPNQISLSILLYMNVESCHSSSSNPPRPEMYRDHLKQFYSVFSTWFMATALVYNSPQLPPSQDPWQAVQFFPLSSIQEHCLLQC